MSRIEPGKHALYLDYLATAPWNRSHKPSGSAYTRRFRGVGEILMLAAIKESEDPDLGLGGRIQLHALSDAVAFYENVCGMTSLGPDELYPGRFKPPLFEMTAAQAAAYRAKTSRKSAASPIPANVAP